MITLAFTRLFSLLPIRHVAIVRGQEVIEASGFSLPHGVRIRTLTGFLADNDNVEFRTFDHPHPDNVWNICLGQIGKDYDWGWYLGLLGLGRQWQDPEKWVCHELLAYACEQAGKAIVDTTLPWIRPEHLYAASQPEEYR